MRRVLEWTLPTWATQDGCTAGLTCTRTILVLPDVVLLGLTVPMGVFGSWPGHLLDGH